jgi:hypothetical protein
MEVMFWNRPTDNKITMLEVPVFWKEGIWGTGDMKHDNA